MKQVIARMVPPANHQFIRVARTPGILSLRPMLPTACLQPSCKPHLSGERWLGVGVCPRLYQPLGLIGDGAVGSKGPDLAIIGLGVWWGEDW